MFHASQPDADSFRDISSPLHQPANVPPDREIGPLLRNLRGTRSLRQVETDTGVSNSYLSTIERNIRRPGIKTLTTLAAYYEVPLSRLLLAAGLASTQAVTERIEPEVEIRRSYEFVLSDPVFREWPKPVTAPSIEVQRFIISMYQHFTGKALI